MKRVKITLKFTMAPAATDARCLCCRCCLAATAAALCQSIASRNMCVAVVSSAAVCTHNPPETYLLISRTGARARDVSKFLERFENVTLFIVFFSFIYYIHIISTRSLYHFTRSFYNITLSHSLSYSHSSVFPLSLLLSVSLSLSLSISVSCRVYNI